MIRHGTKPVTMDKRDYSFHRTFGSVTTFQDQFSVDAGFGVMNQEAPTPLFDIPALPFGCTGFSSGEVCQDQDVALVNPKFIYDTTCAAEGHDETQGCDIRDSLASLIVIGCEYRNETTPGHNRTAYFNVQPGNGLDAFDSIRSALSITTNEKRAVSIGTPWMNEWATITDNGIVPDFFTYDGNPNHYSWHNWVICGWITSNGVPYLQAKTHQGVGYGAGGFSYYARDTINALFEINGVAAFVVTKQPLSGVQTIQLSLYERLVFTLKEYYQAVKNSLSNKTSNGTTVNPDALLPWTTQANCRHNVRAICDLEGLTGQQKDDLSSTVHCESNYNPDCVHPNIVNGITSSTDYGICQVNDYFHIGSGKDFPTVQYVLSNPEACVRWMCKQWLAGNGRLWVCKLKNLNLQYTP